MIISHFPGSGVVVDETGFPGFTYTGVCETVDEGDGNWKLRFLTSGILVLKSNRTVEIFVVGGGGGGGVATTGAGGGGGGGYTKEISSIDLKSGVEYVVTIGDGGAVMTKGGDTSFADIITAEGGEPGSAASGGAGGSGGGCGSFNTGTGFAGGSDGGNGSGSWSSGTAYTGGKGQETTTREFGEPGGTLYSGGGGGGSVDGMLAPGAGGEGGGGTGAKGSSVSATAGTPNTGGGGGGSYSNASRAAAGGSGIAIIRNIRW